MIGSSSSREATGEILGRPLPHHTAVSSKLVSPVVVTDGAKVLVVVIYDFSARCDIHSCTLVFFSLIFHFNLMRL